MKKLIISIAILIGANLLGAQDWQDFTNKKVAEPDQAIHPFSQPGEAWETVYNYHLPNNLVSRGAETDGEHFYITDWTSDKIAKYDMNGNFVFEFSIPGVSNLRDLAYDGTYFYAGDGSDSYLYVLDLPKEILVDTIPIDFKLRAIAYDDDENVFYGNDIFESDIKKFDSQGNVLATYPIGFYQGYSGLAYDPWSEGGPFLWAFCQDGDNWCTLVQLQLPDVTETGFTMDLSYLAFDNPDPKAGGLFTHIGENNKKILGGVLQNESLFGLELGTNEPPVDSSFLVSSIYGEVIDSTDVALSWTPAKYNILNTYLEDWSFPPFQWNATTEGWGWHRRPTLSHIDSNINIDVPYWGSDYALTGENPNHPDGCCDYLITNEIYFDESLNYKLGFDSYYDGSFNQAAYVKYSLDNGETWEIIHTLDPDTIWTRIDIDLSPIAAGSDQPVKLAFHADDNGGPGSGWAIDNIMVYSEEVEANILGYEVYRNLYKIHDGLITDTTYYDSLPGDGPHHYFVKAVIGDDTTSCKSIRVVVPYTGPPPAPPICLAPRHLFSRLNDSNDLQLHWQKPNTWAQPPTANHSPGGTASKHKEAQNRLSGREAFDVQFSYPLAAGVGEFGAESDGEYFYTSKFNNDPIYKYNLDGHLIDSIIINGVSQIRDMAWVPSNGIMYGTNNTNMLFAMDLQNGELIESVELSIGARAIAYDEDLDAFYIQKYDSDVFLVDRQTYDTISSFECGFFSSFSGLAYDNFTEGGPYLWALSNKGPYNNNLVQIKLPEGTETGFVINLAFLSTSGLGLPGGLFIQPDIYGETVTLGGTIYNEVLFGFELGEAVVNFFLEGYNIYMNDEKHNSEVIEDTTYVIPHPGAGTYVFEATAVYVDTAGELVCESDRSLPITTILEDETFLMGGNVFANTHKLDAGSVNVYRFQNNQLTEQFESTVNEIGYYFLPEMYPGHYLFKASPDPSSEFYNTHVPSYIGGKLHWEDAQAIYIDQVSYNNDIHLNPFKQTVSGNGAISGYVYNNTQAARNGMADVQVMLLNSAGECLVLDYTGQEGYFKFNHLAFGTYKLLVEIAGKSMNPVAITLTEEKPEQTDIKLLVDDESIVMGIDEELPVYVNHVSELFPNPANDRVNLSISLEKVSEITFVAYNPGGQKISHGHHSLMPGLNNIHIDLDEFGRGVYYLHFHLNNHHNFVRKLVVNK